MEEDILNYLESKGKWKIKANFNCDALNNVMDSCCKHGWWALLEINPGQRHVGQHGSVGG